MSQTFTIGTQENADIFIIKEAADRMSRQHAIIEIRDDGLILLKDDASKNGTYVNGFRIKKKQIRETDQLIFGNYKAYLHSFLKKENGRYQVRNPLNDFSEEFQQLAPIDKNLRKQIEDLRSADQRLMLFFRLLISIGGVGSIVNIAFPNASAAIANWVRANSSIVTLVAIIYLLAFAVIIYKLYAPGSKNARKTQLKKLEEQHRQSYVCPRCKEYLGWEQEWSQWQRVGKHIKKCGADYVG